MVQGGPVLAVRAELRFAPRAAALLPSTGADAPVEAPALLAARNALSAELAQYLSTGLAAAPFVLGDWTEATKTAEAAGGGGALAAPPGAAARLAVPG